MIRKCPECGWEFPGAYSGTKCKFCKAELTHHKCTVCGAFLPTAEFYRRKSTGVINKVCRTCTIESKIKYDADNPDKVKERIARFLQTHKDLAEDNYAIWHDMIQLPYKPLTEAEWLKACEYFGGCAICGDEHIETREYFVDFKSGGKYAAWNIFPMCGKCATHARFVDNPFVWMDRFLGSAYKLGLNKERRQKLVDYLILQIERSIE